MSLFSNDLTLKKNVVDFNTWPEPRWGEKQKGGRQGDDGFNLDIFLGGVKMDVPRWKWMDQR